LQAGAIMGPAIRAAYDVRMTSPFGI